jgi:hypothetical protein
MIRPVFPQTLAALGLVTLLCSCAMEQKKTEEHVKNMPIDCATADGDLRMLQGEKVSTAQQISSGVRTIVPIGLVVGLVTGTAGTKIRVATGDYNKMLDAKIEEIKAACPDAQP